MGLPPSVRTSVTWAASSPSARGRSPGNPARPPTGTQGSSASGGCRGRSGLPARMATIRISSSGASGRCGDPDELARGHRAQIPEPALADAGLQRVPPLRGVRLVHSLGRLLARRGSIELAGPIPGVEGRSLRRQRQPSLLRCRGRANRLVGARAAHHRHRHHRKSAEASHGLGTSAGASGMTHTSLQEVAHLPAALGFDAAQASTERAQPLWTRHSQQGTTSAAAICTETSAS